LRKVGIVASLSTVINAQLILNDGEERNVKAEDLVHIHNRNGNEVMAVCRTAIGSNENLSTGGFSPGIAYARLGKRPSSAKEYYAFMLDVIGDVGKGILQQNKTVLAPGSDVELYEDTENPMTYLGKSEGSVGYYKDHPKWMVPMNAAFIPYHIGVFATTGAGKSLLTRYQIVPFLQHAGYDVLVLDWKGSDYVAYAKSRFTMSDLALDDDNVVDYLRAAMNDFGYYVPKMIERNPIRSALERVILDQKWRECKTPLELQEFLEKEVAKQIAEEHPKEDAKTGTSTVDYWGKLAIDRYKRWLAKVPENDFANVLGKTLPSQIIDKVRNDHFVAIDVSAGLKEMKLSVFLTIAKYLREMMQEKKELNIALVIDEGPQYCPFMPKGLEAKTTDSISDLCAMGRSYKLSVIILSQGMAGEIGINAAVRRNLNTLFIGKIHPLDMEEAKRLLAQGKIDDKSLTMLPEGDFYFTGKMNPAPVPLLIHFDLPKEAS
jgi:hypothetical protein